MFCDISEESGTVVSGLSPGLVKYLQSILESFNHMYKTLH